MTVEKLGVTTGTPCPRCGSKSGAQIAADRAEEVVTQFFWAGSFYRSEFGGASRIVSNPYRYRNGDVTFAPWLASDAELIQECLKIGLFHYGPPLWRLGEIEPLKLLRKTKSRKKAATSLISEYPNLKIERDFLFHRLRVGIQEGLEADFLQYDSPPEQFLGSGRLDEPGFPVLYASQDMEICFHECRVTLPQECFVAHLRPKSSLNLLDMRAEIENDGPTEFESKNLAIHFIFSADKASYEMTRALSKAAKNAGFDGIIYPSYFSSWKPEKIYNVAIFGRPIADEIVEVSSINRAFLTSASYGFTFGPIFEE